MRRLSLALVLSLLPTLALAEEDADLKALRLEIAALQVDHALNLTRDQARSLLPVLREGAQQVKQMQSARAANKPALLAALTRARDELRATGSVSPATQESVRTARGEGQFKAVHEKVRGLREQAMQILTPQQKEALHQVQLGVMGPGPGFAGAEAGGFEGMPGAAEAGMPGAGHGRGFFKHAVLARVVVSDPFISLVEARAR